MVQKDDVHTTGHGLIVGLAVLQVVLLVIILGFVVAYFVGDSSSTRTISLPKDISLPKSIDNVYHVHARNARGCKFLYDGTYYVLPLGNIQLSSTDIEKEVKPFSLITNGYCTFRDDSSYDYQFGKNLVKAVYHAKDSVYLVVPPSIIEDWVSKKLVTVQDGHYINNYELVMSGGVESTPEIVSKEPEMITLPLPSRGEIPSVVIH